MARLTSLNLGMNDFGAAGAASLAPSLAPSLMAQLTSLNFQLEGNGITDSETGSTRSGVVTGPRPHRRTGMSAAARARPSRSSACDSRPGPGPRRLVKIGEDLASGGWGGPEPQQLELC